MLDLKKTDDISAEEMDDFIEVIGKQMDITINLLTNLVDWGGTLLKKSSAKLKAINLYTLIDDEFNKLDITSTVKQNTLVNNVPTDYWVNTDENMLQFILRNLIINAIKFTEGGSITVSAIKSIDKDKVKVMVIDTGIGMSDEIKNNLFRTNRKSTRKGTNMEEGSGMGLILAREFADKLGSTLSVESSVNVGSTISFDLQNIDPIIE